jgi:hypothetical protein
MHLHTTPALVAAVEADKLAAAGITAATLLTMIAIAIAASVFSNWVASVVLAKPYATLGRAFMTFLAQVLAAIVFVVIVAVGVVLLGAAEANSGVMVIAALGMLITFFVVSVSIPMQIYEIGALRSIGFLLLSGLISGVVTNVTNAIFVGPRGFEQMPMQIEKAITAIKARAQGKKGVDSEIAERKAALKRRYEQLEIRRRYLPANDHKAFAEYERDRAAYQRDLEDFRADHSP